MTATSNCFPYPYETYKVFEHIDMLSTRSPLQLYTTIPALLGRDFGVMGHLWVQQDVITSWLRLTANSNCSSHPYETLLSV